jgi:hypothetical protein
MKTDSFTDFILCTTAIIVAVAVAVLAAINMVEEQTAIVFLGISVACIGMSLLDVETPIRALTGKSSKKSKSRKK